MEEQGKKVGLEMLPSLKRQVKDTAKKRRLKLKEATHQAFTAWIKQEQVSEPTELRGTISSREREALVKALLSLRVQSDKAIEAIRASLLAFEEFYAGADFDIPKLTDKDRAKIASPSAPNNRGRRKTP